MPATAGLGLCAVLPDGILIEPVPATLNTELAGLIMKSPEVFEIVSPDAVKFSSVMFPVPLVLKSKSAFVSIDSILFPVIRTLSTIASFAKSVFQFFVDEPMLYKLFVAGIKSDAIPADIVMLSVV